MLDDPLHLKVKKIVLLFFTIHIPSFKLIIIFFQKDFELETENLGARGDTRGGEYAPATAGAPTWLIARVSERSSWSFLIVVDVAFLKHL